MRKLLFALAATAGLAIPATAPASATSTTSTSTTSMSTASTSTASMSTASTSTASTCRVEVELVDAYDTDEKNGDEIRINLAGYMYPPNGRYVPMSNGDRAYSGNFANPTTTIGITASARFSLREVTLPVVGQGDELGSVTAYGATCATLAAGQTTRIPQHIFGDGYWYYMSPVMTGL